MQKDTDVAKKYTLRGRGKDSVLPMRWEKGFLELDPVLLGRTTMDKHLKVKSQHAYIFNIRTAMLFINIEVNTRRNSAKHLPLTR